MIDFVTASHDESVLKANLLRSEAFMYVLPLVQKGYTNISKAYNAVTTKGITCYIHHDVYLPSSFNYDLLQAIRQINAIDSNWGVLGVAGVKLVNDNKEIYGYICDRGRKWGCKSNLPHEVDTLDEMLLITHGDLKFDENLPQDFYGADLCMQAKKQGRKNYAINAYCQHNSLRIMGGRTESFYTSQEYFKNKWKSELPVATTCALLS